MATEDKSVFATLKELKDLTIDYTKQETIEPIKGLGQFLKLGIGGGLLSSLGLLLLSLALLRGLQTQTGDTFAGNLTFLPYLFTIIGLGVLCVLFGLAIKGEEAMTATERIERADIAAKLRELQGEVDAVEAQTKTYLIGAAVVTAVVAIGIAFAFGRRRGKRTSTVVEIRRI